MREIDIWDIVFWLGLLTIFLWALLKSFGVIHSPSWIEMVPYFGGVVALAGFAFKAGRLFQKVDTMDKSLARLDGRVGDIDKRLFSLTNYVYLKVK